MANTAHANKDACRGISGGLTFELSPSMFSCISCATVCSRILFSSACCRRSFISSRVSSSGCKGRREGGREGHTATMKQGYTAGGVGEGRREHSRTGGLDVSGSHQVNSCYIQVLSFHAAQDQEIIQVAITVTSMSTHTRKAEKQAFITESSSHFTS